jgi:predicted nucleic acid-binding Zn ribbon protein
MEPIQSLLPSAVARLVRPAPLCVEKVLFAWRVCVGPAVARVTRVRLTGDRVLEVELDDGRFGDELIRSAPVILRKVQDLLGADAVDRVAIRRPEPPRRGRRRQQVLASAIRREKGDAS